MQEHRENPDDHESHASTDLPGRLSCNQRVNPRLKKYSAFPKSQITLYQSRPAPERGALAIVTNVGAGCGGRGSGGRATGSQGGLLSVSDDPARKTNGAE